MSSLSEQQASIVNASHLGLGPVVVKAGPGSGKTHTVVSLIKSHLSQGVRPEDVIAITFTRRAARELKERLGREGRGVRASTIDSLALDIVHEQRPELNLLSPSCYWIVFKTVCDMFGIKPTTEKWAEVEELRESTVMGRREPSKLDPMMQYLDNLLSGSNYSDYLGVLIQAIIRTSQSGYRIGCRLLIVDEAQDTSKIQWRLIENLVRASGCQFIVVGDMNQNIYSWRNAAPEVFYRYAIDDDSIALPLKQSFRCSPKIVRASNHLIQFNPDAEADVESTRAGLFHPVKVSTDRAVIEVLNLLEDLYGPDDIAVLCRTNRTVDNISREIREVGVEVNAVHSPEGKVGFLAMAGVFGCDQHNTVNQILFKESGAQMEYRLHGNDAESIIGSLLRQPYGAQVFQYITQCSGNDIVFAEALTVLDDVPLFQGAVDELKKSLGGYYIRDAIERLLAPGEVEESKGAVTVSTIHQAKGLEWPAVVIADLQEGVFPSKKSLRSEDGIIEERRLMYVAMTRAKDRLVLCADPFSPSQFIFPREFYNAEEISGLGQTTIRETGF
jgi:DNA helicase-2/ATP-dependent DNA helicase PcrA